MSKKININWGIIAQGVMALISTICSAITISSCHGVL